MRAGQSVPSSPPSPPIGGGDRDRAYDAFASYANLPDRALVRDVESFLESLHENRLVAPEYRRELELCVDGSDFKLPSRSVHADAASPDDGLFALIVAHMQQARFLLVFTGPLSARNPWLNREVEWWLENRGPDTILIALTHGTDPSSDREGAFPAALVERGLDRQLWFDLRGFGRGRDRSSTLRDYEEERLRIAAALMEAAPQDVIARWRVAQAQQKVRSRRVRAAAASAALIATALIGVSVQRWMSSSRGMDAYSQSLVSRRLAGDSVRSLDALALAAAAAAARPGPEAISALISSASNLPVHIGSILNDRSGHAVDIVRFIAGDRMIVSAGYSRRLLFSAADGGAQLGSVQLQGRPMAIAEAPGRPMLAIATQRGLELVSLPRPGSGAQVLAALTLGVRVPALAFEGSGETLLVGTFDGRLLRFRTADLLAGRTAPLLERHFVDEIGASVGIFGMAIVGPRLVVAGIGGELSCGDAAATGRLPLSRTHSSEWFGLAPLPAAKAAAGSDALGRLVIVSADDCAELRRAEPDPPAASTARDLDGIVRSGANQQRPALGVATSGDAQLVAAGGFDGVARVYTSDTLAPVAAAVHASRARAAALDRSGTRLAVATETGTVETWDLASGVEDSRLAGIEELAADPRGRWLALVDDRGRLSLRGASPQRPASVGQGGVDLVMSHSGNQLAARPWVSAHMWLWQTRPGAPEGPRRIALPDQGDKTVTLGHVAFLRRAMVTADGQEGVSVRSWSLAGARLAESPLPRRAASLAAGSEVVAAGGDKLVTLLRGVRLRPFRQFRSRHPVTLLSVSPDDRLLLVGFGTSGAALCALSAPEPSAPRWLRWLSPTAKSPSPCRTIARGRVIVARFSPASDMLALGVEGKSHDDGELRLFRRDDDWAFTTLDRSGRIQAIGFSSDGELVAGGGTGRAATIYATSDGALTADIPMPNQLRFLAFLPGPERRLLTLDGAPSGVARLWDWRASSLIRKACARWPVWLSEAGVGTNGRTISRAAVCE